MLLLDMDTWLLEVRGGRRGGRCGLGGGLVLGRWDGAELWVEAGWMGVKAEAGVVGAAVLVVVVVGVSTGAGAGTCKLLAREGRGLVEGCMVEVREGGRVAVEEGW